MHKSLTINNIIKHLKNQFRNLWERLRISADHLEIEKGRHKNVASENRICAWCKLCMGQDVIENENRLLNECDLYKANRKVTLQKLSSSLLTSSHSTNTSTHPHFTTSSHSENIITLFPPQDTNSEKNAHFYQIIECFITICFKRCKQLHESLSPAKN